MTIPQASAADLPVSSDPSELASIGTLLHSLSNKLLPIVVFSELALRRCEDIQLKSQLEKIHGAAEQARDLLGEIRTLQGKTESK
ncbi:MAG: hypothetical protein OEZ57_04685 [Nitrospirota bacterium]|nr:hypothetical protein [Nitrospirota bacterium]MDH5586947.1 hypothetical protein [Nitrospirota bacterium]MDH5774192.1 hypothetical protein [Nitrospirota bacterium]